MCDNDITHLALLIQTYNISPTYKYTIGNWLSRKAICMFKAFGISIASANLQSTRASARFAYNGPIFIASTKNI